MHVKREACSEQTQLKLTFKMHMMLALRQRPEKLMHRSLTHLCCWIAQVLGNRDSSLVSAWMTPICSHTTSTLLEGLVREPVVLLSALDDAKQIRGQRLIYAQRQSWSF